jgi:hypothetical protein
MRNLGFDIGIKNILFGNASFEKDKNSQLFLLVQKYILNSKRFVDPRRNVERDCSNWCRLSVRTSVRPFRIGFRMITPERRIEAVCDMYVFLPNI